MKKIISALLCAAILLGFIPFSNTAKTALGVPEAYAEKTEEFENAFEYMKTYIIAMGTHLNAYTDIVTSNWIGGFTVNYKYSRFFDSIEMEYYSESTVLDESNFPKGFIAKLVIGNDSDEWTVTHIYKEKYGDDSSLIMSAVFNPEKFNQEDIKFEFDEKNFNPIYSLLLKTNFEKNSEDLVSVFYYDLDVKFGINLGNLGLTKLYKPRPIPSLKIDGVKLESFEMKCGDKVKLEPEILKDPHAPYRGIYYYSSDDSVATVDNYGHITAVGKGTAEITCTVADAHWNDCRGTCTVTVKPADDGRTFFQKLADLITGIFKLIKAFISQI